MRTLLIGVLSSCVVVFTHLAAGDIAADVRLVQQHVATAANQTFRQASGALQFPYLVPGGPYNQSWDWDSFFLGVALRKHGGLPYLAGTMRNFLAHTNLTTGEVQGCLTPQGPTGAIAHAKPVVVQGAWMAAKGDAAMVEEFEVYRPQMEALLAYWGRPPRRDNRTGLRVWYDQMESGSDNLVTSGCPSKYSFWCWRTETMSYSLASADLNVFLFREHVAFSRFARAWGDDAAATAHEAEATAIHESIEKFLWDEAEGKYNALNVRSGAAVKNRVWLMGLPLWLASSVSSDKTAATPLINVTRAARVITNLMKPDMLSPWGFRSTSSLDPRYNNWNEITPYSNWRGPVWANANALLLYGARAACGASAGSVSCDAIVAVARNLTTNLANDLRATGVWHECWSSKLDTKSWFNPGGKGLAAPGFLSWDTIIATLLEDVTAGVDPYAL